MYRKTIAILLIIKWSTLLISLYLAYRYGLWPTFVMIFIMLYGANLDPRIKKLRILQAHMEKAFDETMDKTFKKPE